MTFVLKDLICSAGNVQKKFFEKIFSTIRFFFCIIQPVRFCLTNSFPFSCMIGDICPQGAYCPAGSVAPSLCNPGTYLNSTGNDDAADCVSCTAGSYCDGSGNILPDGLCAAGYYCPGGQDNPMPVNLNCTEGHYCPEGSPAPIR